jgi:hypothetical protein
MRNQSPTDPEKKLYNDGELLFIESHPYTKFISSKFDSFNKDIDSYFRGLTLKNVFSDMDIDEYKKKFPVLESIGNDKIESFLLDIGKYFEGHLSSTDVFSDMDINEYKKKFPVLKSIDDDEIEPFLIDIDKYFRDLDSKNVFFDMNTIRFKKKFKGLSEVGDSSDDDIESFLIITKYLRKKILLKNTVSDKMLVDNNIIDFIRIIGELGFLARNYGDITVYHEITKYKYLQKANVYIRDKFHNLSEAEKLFIGNYKPVNCNRGNFGNFTYNDIMEMMHITCNNYIGFYLLSLYNCLRSVCITTNGYKPDNLSLSVEFPNSDDYYILNLPCFSEGFNLKEDKKDKDAIVTCKQAEDIINTMNDEGLGKSIPLHVYSGKKNTGVNQDCETKEFTISESLKKSYENIVPLINKYGQLDLSIPEELQNLSEIPCPIEPTIQNNICQNINIELITKRFNFLNNYTTDQKIPAPIIDKFNRDKNEYISVYGEALIGKIGSCEKNDQIVNIDTETYDNYVKTINVINDNYENLNGIGKVIVRLRNQTGTEDTVSILTEGIDNPKCVNVSNVACNFKNYKFGQFNGVFDSTKSTEDIYNTPGIKGVVENMTKVNFDTSFLSYGLSGSGKTYTLIGTSWDGKDGGKDGISQLMVKTIENTGNLVINVKAIQLYNGSIYKAYSDNTDFVYKYTINENETGENIEFVKNEKIKDIEMIIKGVTADVTEYTGPVLTNIGQIGQILKDLGVNVYDITSKYNIDVKNITDLIKFLKNINNKETLLKILNGLKLASVSKPSFKFKDDMLIDRYNTINENKDYFKVYDKTFEDDYVTQFNNYLSTVMKNRPTRATQRNPDSSRSHLFIKLNFLTDDKEFNVFISDLAGTEEPYEYYGEASLEGFYIVSSLKQLEVCVKN